MPASREKGSTTTSTRFMATFDFCWIMPSVRSRTVPPRIDPVWTRTTDADSATGRTRKPSSADPGRSVVFLVQASALTCCGGSVRSPGTMPIPAADSSAVRVRPVGRASPRTSWPRFARKRARCPPVNPVMPVTRILTPRRIPERPPPREDERPRSSQAAADRARCERQFVSRGGERRRRRQPIPFRRTVDEPEEFGGSHRYVSLQSTPFRRTVDEPGRSRGSRYGFPARQ